MYFTEYWNEVIHFLLTEISITYCAQIYQYFFFIDEFFVTITLTVSKSIFNKYYIIVKQIILFHRANTIKLILKKKYGVHSDKPADKFIP